MGDGTVGSPVSLVATRVLHCSHGGSPPGKRYHPPPRLRGRYELRPHAGDIRLALIGEVSFHLDASSLSGTVRPEPPLTLRGVGRRGRTVSAIVGDGSALVEFATFSSNTLIGRP